MKRIKELNSIFICSDCNYKNVDLPFLDMIYSQCTSKHIKIINKIWFDRWRCNDMLYDLYSRNDKYRKFLFL